MRESRIQNRVSTIPVDRLTAHPCNPGRMSKRSFARLVRNIERTGLYEPVVVRRLGDRFQIINGHNRWLALRQLGYETIEALVWDLNDTEAEILLCTLNRLKGSDVLDRKLALLKRLNRKMEAREMAKILPFTSSQIERLGNLKVPSAPAKLGDKSLPVPMVFFLSDAQQQMVAEALASAPAGRIEKTKAARNAAALTEMAQCSNKKDQKDED